MTEAGSRPLRGLKILAVEHMLAMPYATQLLALLGADVIKIEPLAGETARFATPILEREGHPPVGATFLRGNLGKRSIAIDLKHPEGRELLLRLVRGADSLVENMRAGVMDALGLGYDSISEVNPGILYVSLSGFGNLGASPYRDWPAYAPVSDAIAGLYEPNGPSPTPPAVGSLGALGDVAGGLFAAVGLLAALHRRTRTGAGEYVDVALADASLALNESAPLMWSLGVESQHVGGGIVTSFRARDGYFGVTIVRRHMFERFAAVVGHPEWTTDPRFEDRARWAAQVPAVVRPAVEAWAETKSKADAARELAEGGVAAGPSNVPEDLVVDPHFRSRGMLIEVDRDGPNDRPLYVVGNPIRFASEPAPADLGWPDVGEHTRQVLGEELGLASEDVDELIRRGVVGAGDDAGAAT